MTDAWTEGDDFQKKINWDLWRRTLQFLHPYRPQSAMLAVIAVLAAAGDAAVPILTGLVIDEVLQHGAEAELWGYGVAFAVVMIAFSVVILSLICTVGTIATGVSHDIRDACFTHLQKLSFAYFDRRPVGWLMARLTSDCLTLSRVMGWAMLDGIWAPTLILGISAVMLYLNWQLALLVLLIAPPLLIASRYFQVRLLLTSRRVRKLNSRITASFSESIMGVRTTKSMVRESRNLGEFRELSDEMARHSVENALYSAVFIPIVLTLCSAGVGLSLWAGGVQVAGGGLTIGTLVIFISYAGQLAGPIQDMAGTFTMVQGAQASAERINELLSAEPDVKDTPQALQAMTAHQKALAAAPADDPLRDLAEDGMEPDIRTITFEHVGFAYKGGQTVLRDFSLTIQAGQTVALVGPTGGGKSTIVSLLCRFYEPTSGRVLINEVDYRDRSLHWLQSNLGMVLQAPHLFSESIRENIRYGKLDATDQQVEQAAKLVNAHDFITALDKGYDAPVGEGGVKLSTGQKQLVALARAILADPQVLVMDEATSSVDTETERLIQDAIDHVLEDRLAVVIAHRLSTIERADVILFIEDGAIVESGAHADLMAKRGRYYDLCTQHLGVADPELTPAHA